MDLSWFLEFVVLSETMHYANAAEKLYTTQSTLSKHIQAMEKELGAPLFARGYHKLELTPFGRMMLPYAYDILRVKGSYEEAAYRMLHGEAKVLRISAIPALPEYDITGKFLEFQQKYPDVQIAVSEADSIVIRKALLEHQCDLAIMRASSEVADAALVPASEEMLRKVPFCRDELVAVLPLGHPLASAEWLDLRQLANDPFVLIKEGSLPYHLSISACKTAGFVPRVEFTSHNREAILDMVVKGGRTSLMFSSHVQNRQGGDRAFAVVPVRPAIYAEVFIACLKHEPLSEYAEYFISLFRQEDNET